MRCGKLRHVKAVKASLGRLGRVSASYGEFGQFGQVGASCGESQLGKFRQLWQIGGDKMAYVWKSASHIKADANVAGRQCEELERTVGLTAKNLLDANRPEDAPLHNEFEWNDEVAAEQFREHQARHIIACLCVAPARTTKQREEDIQQRAYMKIAVEQPYMSITTIVQSEDSYNGMMAIAKRELQAFERKYKMLKELSPVFDAIHAIGC